MDNYKETFETWNKVAALYESKFMHLDLYNETYSFLCSSILLKGAKILDVGCGPGNIAKYLLAQRADYKILGIDIAPDMISLAKKNNPSASFEVMDIRKVGALQSKFDGIICGFCIPYLSPADNLKLLADAYNLLNGNGLLYLSFVEGNPDKSGFQTSSSGNRAYFYYYEIDALKTQLNELGFEVIKTFEVHYKKNELEAEIHTILIAKKPASSKDYLKQL